MRTKPRSLKAGAGIRVVSPSSEVGCFPRRLGRGMAALRDCGFRPSLSEHALVGESGDAGPPELRAKDIERAFTDPDIHAILASAGGFSSNSVLAHLDFQVIRENPKIFIGFSDITVILNAIYAETGLVTFHGPSLLPTFGDTAGIHPLALRSFLNMLTWVEPFEDVLPEFPIVSDRDLVWEKEDEGPRTYVPARRIEWISSGTATGILVGGNIESFLRLIGTRWCPPLNGALLLLEDAEGDFRRTKSGLTQLCHLGVMDRIGGIIFGHPPPGFKDSAPPHDWLAYLGGLGRRYGIPVAANVPFGHTEPKSTIPIGVKALMDASARTIRLCERPVYG